MHHVVLVTYGEPETPAFLEHLTYSWRILLGLTRTVAPIPRPLLPLIALARARSRNASWRDERYGSPLEPITRQQAGQIEAALAARRGEGACLVRVAYEFREPLLRDVLRSLPARDTVSVVPLYATDSAFTHGLSRDLVEAHLRDGGAGRAVHVVPALEVDELAAISATHVRASLDGRGEWRGRDVALVLAAHGTLVNPPRPIDTGLAVTERLCGAIRERLAPDFGLIVNGWLNHTRGGTWTSPSIDRALAQVAEARLTKVVYFPYGFLADNAESQLEGRVALRGQPSLSALHLPCLNDSPRLASALARQVAT